MCSGRCKDRYENKIGDVAEYETAAHCRAMGLQVRVVGGSAPWCDLLVGDTTTGIARMIEVKGTVGSTFIVGVLPRKDERAYVFVHFRDGEKKLKPRDRHIGRMDFYILTSEEVDVCWEANLGRKKKGGVRITKIEQYKGQWYKVKGKKKRERTRRDEIQSEMMAKYYPKYYQTRSSGKLRKGKTRSLFMKRVHRETHRILDSIAL